MLQILSDIPKLTEMRGLLPKLVTGSSTWYKLSELNDWLVRIFEDPQSRDIPRGAIGSLRPGFYQIIDRRYQARVVWFKYLIRNSRPAVSLGWHVRELSDIKVQFWRHIFQFHEALCKRIISVHRVALRHRIAARPMGSFDKENMGRRGES